MERRFYTISDDIIDKLEKTDVAIINIQDSQPVIYPKFWETFFADLAIGISNMRRDYDLNDNISIIDFFYDYEQPAASNCPLDITFKMALNKLLEMCKKNNWRIFMSFEEPIFNIKMIEINMRNPATHEIFILSTNSLEKNNKSLPLYQFGDDQNNTIVIY